jgi:hypothetical protein
MSEKDKELAKEAAARAARQARYAAQNVAGAAEHEKDHLVDAVNKVADPIKPVGLMAFMGELGTGFVALTGAVVLGTTAAQRFRAAYQARTKVVSS